ncbi:hypothetical protein LBMAG47_20970 [Planctomycetia bacterium]|nr:hypothetical protein LBMAG47_20970 [Planctomycetia bacterium]
MAEQVDVRSIDTLAFVKGALAAFAHEAGQAISEMELQGQRGIDWVTVERAAYWKAEIRRRSDVVNQAMKDLEHCRTFKKVGDNTPSCVEEKKVLAKARRRLEIAEEKAQLVRRWTPVVLQQFRETCVRLTRFREVIDLDCPRALAELERMLRALDAYQNVAAVRDEPAPEGGVGTASVTRQDVESSPAAPAPAAPASGGGS